MGSEMCIRDRVEPLAAYVDAGEPGRLRVASDGDRAASERGPVQDEPADDGDRGEDEDQRRDAEDVGVGQAQVEDGLDGDDPVSYTHLTLPTICSV